MEEKNINCDAVAFNFKKSAQMDKHQQTEPSLTNLSFKNVLARGVAHAYNQETHTEGQYKFKASWLHSKFQPSQGYVARCWLTQHYPLLTHVKIWGYIGE